ncbi:MAG: N-formylglutamate amidohydrolase, partial [Candidatus Puniceispirillum sp.]
MTDEGMANGRTTAFDFSQSPTASSCCTDDANFAAISRRDGRSTLTENGIPHSSDGHSSEVHASDIYAPRALVLSCPHAGRLYPADFVATSALALAALQDLEDYAVDWLIEGMIGHNITAITNHVGRAFLDVNRPADALDKIMFANDIDAAAPSRQVKAGYG